MILDEIRALRDVEKEHILKVLAYTIGNRRAAAKLLKISMRTLRNRLHEYGMMDYLKTSRSEHVKSDLATATLSRVS